METKIDDEFMFYVQISRFLDSIHQSAILYAFFPFIADRNYKFHFDAKIAFLVLMVVAAIYVKGKVDQKKQNPALEIDQFLLWFVQGILMICVTYIPYILNQKGFVQEIYPDLGVGAVYFIWGLYLEPKLKYKIFMEEIKDLPEYEKQQRIESLKHVFGFKLFK